MRPFLSVLLSSCVTWLAVAQAVPPGDLIPLGTAVEIELLENVSSETLQAGQSVPFKLVRAVEANGETLAGAGTQFKGTVTSANAARHWGKAGAFDLKLESLKVADGNLIWLDFHRPTRLNTRPERTDEALRTSLAMTYYFPLIPVALLAGSRKGKPFKIRAGERYLVYVVGVQRATSAPEPAKP